MVNTEIKLITFFVAKDREAVCIQSAKPRLGADWGSDNQLIIAKFRFKLKKTGESNRAARYDLNQVPYEFAVEVMNRFKGLDLVNSVPEALWTEVHNILREMENKTIPLPKK